jgi:hypothetical protein
MTDIETYKAQGRKMSTSSSRPQLFPLPSADHAHANNSDFDPSALETADPSLAVVDPALFRLGYQLLLLRIRYRRYNRLKASRFEDIRWSY